MGRGHEGGRVIRFGWLSFTLAIGALQGLVVATLLAFRRENREANLLLSAFLAAFVARIVPFIIGFAGFYEAYPWLSFAPFGITLASATRSRAAPRTCRSVSTTLPIRHVEVAW